MLEVTVVRTVGKDEFSYRRFEQLVQIPAVSKLTPATARQAIAIAFGGTSNATVYDAKAGYGYRVYDKSARKVRLEGEVTMTQANFVNIDERYGDEYEVTIQDYLDINPEGDFEEVGNEIRELFDHEWFQHHQDILQGRNITMTGNFTGYMVVARRNA